MSKILKGEGPNDFYLGQPVAYIPAHLTQGKTMVQIENMIHNSEKGVEFGIIKTKRAQNLAVVFFPAAVLLGLMEATAPSCYFRDIYYAEYERERRKP